MDQRRVAEILEDYRITVRVKNVVRVSAPAALR